MNRLTFYDNMEKFWRVVDDAEVRDGLPTKGEYVEQSVIDRLAAYEDAEEQGRLIVLPCKVGDTVYYAYDHRFVTEQKISRVSYTTGIGFEFFCDYNRYTRDYEFYFTPESIGHKVFFNREEAEAALGGDAT